MTTNIKKSIGVIALFLSLSPFALKAQCPTIQNRMTCEVIVRVDIFSGPACPYSAAINSIYYSNGTFVIQ